MIILINLYPSRRGFPGVINVPFSFVSHHESTVNQERFTSVMPFFSDGALDGISSTTNSIITSPSSYLYQVRRSVLTHAAPSLKYDCSLKWSLLVATDQFQY